MLFNPEFSNGAITCQFDDQKIWVYCRPTNWIQHKRIRLGVRAVKRIDSINSFLLVLSLKIIGISKRQRIWNYNAFGQPLLDAIFIWFPEQV